MGLPELAGRIAAAGEQLAGCAAQLPQCDPGAGTFGVDGAGRIAEIGRLLQLQFAQALDARAAETTAHAGRLTDLATRLGQTINGYSDAEHAAHQQQSQGDG